MVDAVRRITGEKKVGHAGTLDPFASGLLVMGVGREATRRLGAFLNMDKTYEAVAHLGATSTTGDLTGVIENVECEMRNGKCEMERLTTTLKEFQGVIQQVPPMYSAKKIAGQKLYDLARRGEVIERKPFTITIHSIELLDFQWPRLTIRVSCSSGTYIRVLAEDIGKKLECGGHCEELIRTSIGPYQLKDAHSVEELEKGNWVDQLFQVN